MAFFDGKSLLPISLSLLSAALLLSLICNTDARVADTSLKSVDAQNGNGASEPKCEFMPGETANCETCIFKGPHCFWCETTKQCNEYKWKYPNCTLDAVRYKNCWLNWKALGISLSIVGVMVLIIACCCCCYCCHYCKKCKRRWTEYNFKRQREREMAKRLAMENRQEQRRMERKAQIDAIRQKYGIPSSEPHFQRMNSGSGSSISSKLSKISSKNKHSSHAHTSHKY